jgi:hypothetical protein
MIPARFLIPALALFAAPALADTAPSGGKELARYLDGAWSLAEGSDTGPFPGLAFGCEEAIIIEAPAPDDEWVEVRIPHTPGLRLEVTTLGDIFVFTAEPFAGFWKSPDTFAIAPKDVVGGPKRDAARELQRCK